MKNKLPILPAFLLLSLGGCVSLDFTIPQPIQVKKQAEHLTDQSGRALAPETRATGLYQTPSPEALGRAGAGKQPPSITTSPEKAETTLMFDQVPINTFIQAIFANVLKRNVAVDEAIAKRQDLVTLRTPRPQTPSEIFTTSRLLLKSYGIAVNEYGNTVRITADNAQSGYLPEIRRGRALPDTPGPLRPIFQLVELQSVRPQDVSTWLTTMFGNKVKVQDDNLRQAIMLSGQSDDVTAAMEAILVLDQPTMRGRNSVRIVPAFWSADEMTKRLAEVLQAQGFNVSTQINIPAPLILLPINALNSIIVFSATEGTLTHVLNWVRELDQPTTGRGSSGYFTYTCRFADADELAKTLQGVMSGSAIGQQAAVVGQTQQPTTAAARPISRVVVNKSTNSLIIQGSPDEYNQWLGLLRELDRPAKAALITVTVAEVRLGDKEQLGVEWAMKQANVSGNVVNMGTVGSFGTASIGGLITSVVSGVGNTRLLIEALASSSRARILSNPSVVTRNGETATIQVGQEVPVITSQQSNANTTGGVLQTVQYRQTGVILKVRPIIHAGGRVELDVSQEVSSAAETKTGVSTSPTISTRKVDTKLSVADGSTILMGGLMSQSDSRANSGVPILMNIPILGALFRSNTDSVDKTELLVMITPNVINDDFDAQQVTETFRAQMAWAKNSPPPTRIDGNPDLQTLPPPSVGKGSGLRSAHELSAPPETEAYRGTKYQPPSAQIISAAAQLPPPPLVNDGQSVAKEQQSAQISEKVSIPGGGQGTKVTDNEVLEELRKANEKKSVK